MNAHAASPDSGAAASVREAVATITTVLFLEEQRREAIKHKAYNRELSDLVLTAERQFLWDALQRIQSHENTGQVALSEFQAKQIERLATLRGSVGTGDASAARVLADLERELRARTRLPQPSEAA